MLVKYVTAGLVASALLTSVSFAQTSTAPNNMAPATASNSSYQGEWRASKLAGLSVYNNDNQSIGSINDLLTDRNGNIKTVILGVGGLLGVGEHLVAVDFNKVKFVDQPVPSTTTSSNSTAPARPASTTTTGSASSSSSTAKNWYPDHAVFNATKDELKAMPEFKY